MSGIKIRNLSKTYWINNQEINALHNINLDVKKGSFITIVGKSGCGKTTLLRILSNLENKTNGTLFFEGESEPRISIVFQEPRLMPWLTVKQNMKFSLLKEKNKNKSEEIVNKYLEILDLTRFKDAYPNQISGGMAQRVALGRTLCYEPDIILMDEPLGALDAYNRRLLQDELIKIFKECNKTIIFVTHDIDEAIYLGQKLIIINEGSIQGQINIDKQYPRDMNSIDFLKLREQVLKIITNTNYINN